MSHDVYYEFQQSDLVEHIQFDSDDGVTYDRFELPPGASLSYSKPGLKPIGVTAGSVVEVTGGTGAGSCACKSPSTRRSAPTFEGAKRWTLASSGSTRRHAANQIEVAERNTLT